MKFTLITIIFVAMFTPVRAQKPERQNWLISADSILPDNTKKDTILVDALCKHESSNGVVMKHWLQVDPKLMERTLEWQWVSIHTDNPATTGMAGSRQWVVIETRYLEDVDGCYQLVSLKY